MKVVIAGIEGKIGNYVAALEAVGLSPVVTMDAAALSDCAGLVLPGGGDVEPALYGMENQGSEMIDRALDEAQLAVTDAFVRAGKPVFGICRGAQLLNVYFGGTLIQHLATFETHRYHEEGPSDSVHPCVSAEDGLLCRLYGRRFAVNSAHHQALARLGDGLRATAWAEDGVVEFAEHGTLPVIASQFHPERMCFANARPDTVDGAPLFLHFRSLLEKA